MATADVALEKSLSTTAKTSSHGSQLGSGLSFGHIILCQMSFNLTKTPDLPVSIGSIVLAVNFKKTKCKEELIFFVFNLNCSKFSFYWFSNFPD